MIDTVTTLRPLRSSTLALRDIGSGHHVVLVREAKAGAVIIGPSHSRERRGHFWLHGPQLKLAGQARDLTFFVHADTRCYREDGPLHVDLGYCRRSDGRAMTRTQHDLLQRVFDDAFTVVQDDLSALMEADEWLCAEDRLRKIYEEIDTLTVERDVLEARLARPRPW